MWEGTPVFLARGKPKRPSPHFGGPKSQKRRPRWHNLWFNQPLYLTKHNVLLCTWFNVKDEARDLRPLTLKYAGPRSEGKSSFNRGLPTSMLMGGRVTLQNCIGPGIAVDEQKRMGGFD